MELLLNAYNCSEHIGKDKAVTLIYDKSYSIEQHYNSVKRFGEDGELTHLEIGPHKFDKNRLEEWKVLLWFMYLDENSKLVESLRKYRDFTDNEDEENKFSHIVSKFVHQGSFSVLDDCSDLLWVLTSEGAECL